jgi:hypothetical protein
LTRAWSKRPLEAIRSKGVDVVHILLAQPFCPLVNVHRNNLKAYRPHLQAGEEMGRYFHHRAITGAGEP